jgi:anti-sigma factor RsiW
MVTGTHPDDLDLFDYVEGDLPGRRRAELEVHLASCAQCAEHVARMQAGRDALRSAQFLQLPPSRRDAILRSLPAQREAARPLRAPSIKRLLAVLAPVAALAAVVVALVTTAGNGNGQEAGEAAGTMPAARTAAQDQAGGGAESLAPAITTSGFAPAVADELRRKGLDARVVGEHVEVRDATRREVKRALADSRTLEQRGRNDVEIVIVP